MMARSWELAVSLGQGGRVGWTYARTDDRVVVPANIFDDLDTYEHAEGHDEEGEDRGDDGHDEEDRASVDVAVRWWSVFWRHVRLDLHCRFQVKHLLPSQGDEAGPSGERGDTWTEWRHHLMKR